MMALFFGMGLFIILVGTLIVLLHGNGDSEGTGL